MKSKANAHVTSCKNPTAGKEIQGTCPLGVCLMLCVCVCVCVCVFMGVCETPCNEAVTH